ncbi:GntR family transcriptional regulator [Kribbella sp. NPDC050820]|uniref:GntR family transcriptional regulator n=1 Tax=Kribbella sp. NPDC050820 TaxID=3155408 RepID=UPI0033E4DBAC
MHWRIDHDSLEPLRDQIVAAVRRGIGAGELVVGDALPPAAELAEALGVDRNTVLAAYRALRDDGILDFRRGRGVRVARAKQTEEAVIDAARRLIALGRRHGMDRDDLLHLVKELT